MFCYKQNRPQNESGGVRNCENAVCLFVRKSGLSRIILPCRRLIRLVLCKEFRHSAVGLTVSVGRNDYKGYKLFCNAFFQKWHYLSHPRASAARPWDLFDCRVKPDNDRKRRKSPSGLSRGSKDTRHGLTICTQKAARFNKGSCRSRCCGQAGYSLRASTKVRAAAGVAVKLATASGQGRPFVKLAITC